MAKIAISYRRSDSQDITSRIFDRLVHRYGKNTVFRDIDSIHPGIDFRRQIADALRTTDVLLVVAGPGWLGQGNGPATRMENEADPVRIEVETALKRDIPIIPILVNGMSMPQIGELPSSLKDLAYRHAVTVDGGRDFDHHIDGLIRALDRIVAPQASDTAPARDGDRGRQSTTAVQPPAAQVTTPVPVAQPSASLPPPVATAQAPATASAAMAPAPLIQPQPRVADIPIAATPAFDCSKSHAVDELAVCRSGQLSYLDQQLNVVFNALRNRLSKDQQATLWAQEQEWLKQRAACISDEARIREAYLSRIAQLQSWH